MHHRPLEITFWIRLKQFLRGIFLYGTVYWRRASDDLEVRHMSRDERDELRPRRDLNIIRPREQPRPPDTVRLPEESGGEGAVLTLPGSKATPRVMRNLNDDELITVHRRKKRRRSRKSKVMPKSSYAFKEMRGSFWKWLMK